MSSINPFMATNPYLPAGFQSRPAAYSQNIGVDLFASSGQALPINTYPTWNPFGSFLGGGQTLPWFQSLGFSTPPAYPVGSQSGVSNLNNPSGTVGSPTLSTPTIA